MVEKFIPNNSQIDYLQIAERMINYSGSDIRLVCKEAAMRPLRRLLSQIESVSDDPKYQNYFDDSK